MKQVLVRAVRSAISPCKSARSKMTRAALVRRYTTEVPEAKVITDSKSAWWTLKRSEYIDPARFDLERIKLFSKTWQLVGRSDQVAAPGQYLSKVVAGYPVFVIRDREGKLKGFHNVCLHRAHPIVPFDAAGKCDILRCKYHGWVYDGNGNLRKAPQIELSQELKSTMGLKRIQSAEWNGLIFINIDTYGPEFEQFIGDMPSLLPPGLDLAREYEYRATRTWEVACNWKVYVDNYCEGYHIPTAHPGLDKMIDSKNSYQVTSFSEQRTFAVHSVAQRPGSPTGGLWIYTFPNWAINIYDWGMDVELMIPVSPTKTVLELYYYTKKSQAGTEEADKKLNELLSTSKVVVEEDIALVEAVQRNLEAGIYERGVLCPEKENGVYDFKNEYHKYLNH